MKKWLSYLRETINLGVSYFKVYRFSLFMSLIYGILSSIIFIISIYLFLSGTKLFGNLNFLDILIVFFVSLSVNSFVGLIKWKPSYSSWMDFGKISTLLIRPFSHFTGRIYYDFNGFWLTAFLTNFVILSVLIFYGSIKGFYIISLKTLFSLFLSFSITLIYYFSLNWLILALDFLKKRTSSVVYDSLETINSLTRNIPGFYFSKNLIIKIIFMISIYIVVYFTFLQTLKGNFDLKIHFGLILASLILFKVSNKIIDNGLKKYEGYL